MSEARTRDTGSIETGPNDTGSVETGPNETGPIETGPSETDPSETGSTPGGTAGRATGSAATRSVAAEWEATGRRLAAETPWWAHLGEAERAELDALWDARAEQLSPARDRESWRRLPIVLEAVDEGEAACRAEEDAEAERAFREWLVAHGGVGFFEGRPFHICRARPEAAAVVRTGRLPAAFRCPLDRGASCPLGRVSERAGVPLRLRPRVQRPHEATGD